MIVADSILNTDQLDSLERFDQTLRSTMAPPQVLSRRSESLFSKAGVAGIPQFSSRAKYESGIPLAQRTPGGVRRNSHATSNLVICELGGPGSAIGFGLERFVEGIVHGSNRTP